TRNHRSVRNRGMSKNDRLQLGRRNLKALVLNQLLDPIDNIEMSVFVGIANVAGVQPAVRVDGPPSSLGIIQIALHDLRSAHAHLAFLIGTELGAAAGINELALRIRRRWADRSQFHPGRISRAAMGDRTGFSHAVSLANATTNALHAGARKLRTQRSRA